MRKLPIKTKKILTYWQQPDWLLPQQHTTMTPHQQMLEDHKEAKAKRREDHRRNGGKKFRYSGNLY